MYTGRKLKPTLFRKEKNNLKDLIDKKKYRRFRDLFTIVQEEHPQVIRHLLHDLLHVEGYTENELAFAMGIPIHFIRKIYLGDLSLVNRDIFLSIMSLYARVFCGWCMYNDY